MGASGPDLTWPARAYAGKRKQDAAEADHSYTIQQGSGASDMPIVPGELSLAIDIGSFDSPG